MRKHQGQTFISCEMKHFVFFGGLNEIFSCYGARMPEFTSARIFLKFASNVLFRLKIIRSA